MAEAIFNALAEDSGLPLRSESAGVAALEGESMAPNAAAALRELGIHPGRHRARQVNETMVDESTLVLAMSPWHLARLYPLGGDTAGKLHTLLEYTTNTPDTEGIPDPYGGTIIAYRASVKQLLEHVRLLMRHLTE